MLDTVNPTQESQQYYLGLEFDYQGKRAIVTRIVDQCAMFEIPIKRYYVDEMYVEFLTEQGEVGFISLKRQVHDMERPPDSKMRGPEPILKMAEDGI